MSELKPKLSSDCLIYDLGNKTFVVHHRTKGARFSLKADEANLLKLMDGKKSLDELHEGFRKERGAFAFKDIQVLLFQLWSHGLLENGESIRAELFAEHERPEFVQDSVWNKLKVLTAAKWMPKTILGGHNQALVGIGKLASNPKLLWLGVLLSILPLPLYYYGKLTIPSVFFRHEGSWVSGIILAYSSLALILSYRGLIRTAVASQFSGFQFRAGVQIRLGIIHFDMDDEHVDFLPAGQQVRFALAGLAAIGGVAGICAAAQLLGAPNAISYILVGAFILGVIDLCPLMPTDGERLIESLLHANRPESIRRYIGQRMIRDLMVKHDDEFGSITYPLVATLWILWVGVALEVFQRFVLSDILAFQTAIWTTERLDLQLVGGAFFTYIVSIILVFCLGLSYVGISLILQLLSPDRLSKPTAQSSAKDLSPEDLSLLMTNIQQISGAQIDDAAFVEGLMERLNIQSFKKGAWIQRAGRRDHRFFFVLEGTVDLLHCYEDGRHEFVATMAKGESFGDEGLTGHSPIHDAKAHSDCKVGCLDGDIFRALIDDMADDQTSQILQRAHFLDQVPELSGLGSAGRLRLAYSSQDRQVDSGKVVIRQGDPPQSMFIIKSGHCDVAQQAGGEDRNIAKLGPGQTFGERGLLRGEPRNATVTAVDTLNIVEIPREALESALSASFHVGLALEQLDNQRKAKES